MQKILVTGATGFIGNYVVEELLKNGYDVIASGIEKNIDKIHWKSDVRYIQCDLSKKKENFYSYLSKPDILIHLAWKGLPNYNELFHFEENLFDSYRFIKNMISNGLNNLSVIGTCFEYGMQNDGLSENLPTFPVTAYALAKDTLRKFIEQLNTRINFNFKWIRLFYMYGKGQNKSSILSQLDTAIDNSEQIFNMSKGDQLRDYLPVEKVAEYIVKISLQKQITGIVNCCSGHPISIRSLVKNRIKIRKSPIKLNLGFYPYLKYEPMFFWGTDTKLQKILNHV
ncbi:MAG TPA: NAD-dependent epimerase/dehydratase family protein [Victivallales bacterium]|nr:NAD-dependent epimerase/dehydratase family protein [Victivallales bacterium]